MRDLAGSVHVAQNEVAAEFLSRGERLFQIDARAFLQRAAAVCAEGGLANGFSGEISGEALFIDGDYGEAAAVHGDAVGYSEIGRERWCVNGDADAVVFKRQRLDPAKVLDDSGEHEYEDS